MTSADDQRVAERIRIELARRRVHQTTVARQLGMHQKSFSRRMTGQVPFRATELITVANILGLTVEDLYRDDAA